MYCLLKLYRIDDLWWPWRSFKGHLMIRLRKSENKDNIFKIQICDVATRSIPVIYMAGKYYTYTIISTNKISGIFKCIAVATAQTFKEIMEFLLFFHIYLALCKYRYLNYINLFFIIFSWYWCIWYPFNISKLRQLKKGEKSNMGAKMTVGR